MNNVFDCFGTFLLPCRLLLSIFVVSRSVIKCKTFYPVLRTQTDGLVGILLGHSILALHIHVSNFIILIFISVF